MGPRHRGQLNVLYGAHGFWCPGAYVSYGNTLATMAALTLGRWGLRTPRVRRYTAVCGAGALIGLA